MKISITVKPNAKNPGVEKRPDGSYKVSVKSPPTEGKANAEVIKVLAEYFRVPKSDIEIVRGASGKKKWVEIRKD
ncbi:MAG: DUF167 domain-containing protein [Deltaproteobacteria bacterium]|nr:DUF167 domain-containing protein [Deltaproteobacteria bacterium]